MAVAAIGQPIELDGTAQQGTKIANFYLHTIDPYPGVDSRFFPELWLAGEERGVDAVNLELYLHSLFGSTQLFHLARFQPQIEHRRADADAVCLIRLEQPALGLGITGTEQRQLLIGVEAVNSLAAARLHQLDATAQPGTGRTGLDLDTAQISIYL